MTWTAAVIAITPTSDGLETAVVITDNVAQKFVETFHTDGSLLSLRNQVRQRTVVADAIHTKPEYSVGDALNLNVDAVTPPVDDPAADARAAFVTAYALYQALNRGLAAGLVTSDAVTQQQSAMAKLFDPSYVSFL